MHCQRDNKSESRSRSLQDCELPSQHLGGMVGEMVLGQWILQASHSCLFLGLLGIQSSCHECHLPPAFCSWMEVSLWDRKWAESFGSSCSICQPELPAVSAHVEVTQFVMGPGTALWPRERDFVTFWSSTQEPWCFPRSSFASGTGGVHRQVV